MDKDEEFDSSIFNLTWKVESIKKDAFTIALEFE